MKNKQKGSILVVAIVIAALVIIGGGGYVYSTKKANVNTGTTQIDISSELSVSTTSNTVAKINSNNVNLTDSIFLAAVGESAKNVWARGDINSDGHEDAVVGEVNCGASCSIGLQVVLNEGNGTARLLKDKNYPDTFSPAYLASSAVKSQVTSVTIRNGIISLTGKGLDCKSDYSSDSDICTEEKWNVVKTVTYKFDGKNIVQLSVNPLSAKPVITKGEYQFGEFSRGLSGESVVWEYKLNLKGDGGVGQISLTIVGFHTLTSIYATGKISSDGSLDVVFDSYGEDNMSTSYKKGEVLFTLKPTQSGLSIEWKKMQPVLEKTKGGLFVKI